MNPQKDNYNNFRIEDFPFFDDDAEIHPCLSSFDEISSLDKICKSMVKSGNCPQKGKCKYVKTHGQCRQIYNDLKNHGSNYYKEYNNKMIRSDEVGESAISKAKSAEIISFDSAVIDRIRQSNKEISNYNAEVVSDFLYVLKMENSMKNYIKHVKNMNDIQEENRNKRKRCEYVCITHNNNNPPVDYRKCR